MRSLCVACPGYIGARDARVHRPARRVAELHQASQTTDQAGTGHRFRGSRHAGNRATDQRLRGERESSSRLHGSPHGLRTIVCHGSLVRQATDRQIVQVVSDSQVKSRSMLVNAICFKGLWAEPFDAEESTVATFHAPGGSSRFCPGSN